MPQPYTESTRGSSCFHQVADIQLLLSEALDPDLDATVVANIFDTAVLPKLEAVDCNAKRMFGAC